MKLNSRGIISIFVILTSITSVQAQSPREQLSQMVEQLQKAPTDSALREKIIKLAPTLKPSPALPDVAVTFEGRAQFAFRSAKSESDFLAAAQEYEKAALAAPWVPGYYADLCTIYEKVGKFEDAKRHCGFYLIALSDPAQITDVRRRIAGLDFGIEKANSPQARAERERDEFAIFLRQNEGAVFKHIPNKQRSEFWEVIKIQNGGVLFETYDQTAETLHDNPHLRGRPMLSSASPAKLTGFTSSYETRGTRGHVNVLKLTFSRDGKILTHEGDSDVYAKGPSGTYSEHSRSYFTKIFQRQ